MKKFEFVSIIVPVKNEVKYIGRCLKSLSCLNYDKNLYEVIIVDNESSDGTVEIIKKFISENDNYKLKNKSNGTIASVRMEGFSAAKGSIIGFLDGDSVVPPDWLDVGLEILNGEESISCVGFAVKPPDVNSTWVELAWHKISSGSKYSGTCQVPWLSSFNLLLKRKFFEEVGGFDQSLVTCEDADLGYRLNSISKNIYSNRLFIEHLGTVKTLCQFIKKERWRGQSNLKSFLKSKDFIKDGPSVFIPLLYLIVFILFFISIFLTKIHLSFFLFLMIIFFPVYLSYRKRIFGIKCFIEATLLYIFYLLARGSSLII